ncbi:DUF1127 domain-containing protein [Ruegeria sp. 2205SS24-7]|uniref:DUF1127 domain-containing protein n=1 Tax=Ruegeria discodermiae TaxID=3064389 RepID=UPI002741346F|nr:DUF1127 domain-containing protein [Ruegeria sp. 2205SS24-7]MDP5217662.1 DUF1127 domain-containing protein [Ruegeria sp. 2205SS24-7]
MTYTLTNTSAPIGIFARLNSFFQEAKEARARHALYVQTVRELERLTDRELADVGLSRSNITDTVHRHVYGN